MTSDSWQLQEAKSKFSQLVDKAMQHKPQIVTKHGNNAVVILSFDDYKNMLRPENDLVTFLRHSPLMDEELDISRNNELPRDIIL